MTLARRDQRVSHAAAHSWTVAVALGLLFAPTANAETGVTNTINGTTQSETTTYVGEAGPFNALLVTGGGSLQSQQGVIGMNGASSNNIATVNGSPSVWEVTTDLYTGWWGSANRLTVASGGRVWSANGYVGLSAGASNNSVLVTDAGSEWLGLDNLIVGVAGPGNRLIITNDAAVSGNYMTIGSSGGSTNNTVVVAGLNSSLTPMSRLTVGQVGSHNRLVISDGGQVFSTDGYVGFNASSSNNIVTLAGFGSYWDSYGELVVGYGGAGNQLTASGVGGLTSSNAIIGQLSSAANNRVLLDGMEWQSAHDFTVGYTGSGNQLTVTNSGTVFSRAAYIGRDAAAANNTVILTGAGSRWNNTNDFIVGYSGSVNQITLAAASRLSSSNGIVGCNAGSTNNTVLVTGSSTLWENAANLTVGEAGAGNRLAVSNGAWVVNQAGVVGASGSNNTVLVTGVGSLWRNYQDLEIGRASRGNSLIVTNGSSVLGDEGYIGKEAAAVNNAVAVGGSAGWNLSSNLYVGYSGARNQLTISGGGYVHNTFGYVGHQTGANGNAVLITGGGSGWQNTADVSIGESGSRNSLVITNGGLLLDTYAYIGHAGGASGNTALVSGVNSRWFTDSNLYVGYYGSTNHLTINDGGTVVGSYSYIGAYGTNNSALVTGAGSLWTNIGVLSVGNRGAGNQFTISNGASVLTFRGYVGNYAGATNNAALVTGTGSLWSNPSHFAVGYYASGNRLTVSAGGVVKNTDAYVGYMNNANNNLVTVTGAGSVWNSQSNLFLGGSGLGNQLTVTSGGRVENNDGCVGCVSSASNNIAYVSGSSSVWQNRSNLYVGLSGASNRLNVEWGGRVESDNAYIGYDIAASGNIAWLYGSDARWSNRHDLVVGAFGHGNGLTIQNGGGVENDAGWVGMQTGADANGVWLDHGNWINHSDLRVGHAGSGNSMTAESGSYVTSQNGFIGVQSAANENTVTLDGSTWDNADTLFVGYGGSLSRLALRGGAHLLNTTAYIGFQAGADANAVDVAGSGTRWENSGDLVLGYAGYRSELTISNSAAVIAASLILGNNSGSINNSLTLTNGGHLTTASATIGAGGTNNVAVVAGSASTWTNNGSLYIGSANSHNRLRVSDGGSVTVSDGLVIGQPSTSDNHLQVEGGSVRVTNASYSAGLDVRGGSLDFRGGSLTVDVLLATSPGGSVNFAGGTLATRATTVNNGSAFTVGNGSSTAVLDLLGGTHSFTDGLTIRTNAFLIGTGTIVGDIANFGTIAIGNSPGAMTNIGDLVLGPGSISEFEIAGLAQGSQYDYFHIEGNLSLDGILNVRFLDSFQDHITFSDTFTLFTATGNISGAFDNIINGYLPTADGHGFFKVQFDAGHSFILREFQTAPEPSTGILMLFGLAACASKRRRRHRCCCRTVQENRMGL